VPDVKYLPQWEKRRTLDSVYIETTIPSYLTAWPARNLIAAAHQAMTRDWWDLRRSDFHLFTSQTQRDYLPLKFF